MFKCDICKAVVGPYIKPITNIAATRRVTYHNVFFVEDEWGNREKREVDSVGTEIVATTKSCASCAQVDTDVPAHPVNRTLVMGKAFQEPMVKRFEPALIVTAFSNAMDRTYHKSKRAMRDAQTALSLVKFFADNNKKFAF